MGMPFCGVPFSPPAGTTAPRSKPVRLARQMDAGLLSGVRCRDLIGDPISFHMELDPVISARQAERSKGGVFVDRHHESTVTRSLPSVNDCRYRTRAIKLWFEKGVTIRHMGTRGSTVRPRPQIRQRQGSPLSGKLSRLSHEKTAIP